MIAASQEGQAEACLSFCLGIAEKMAAFLPQIFCAGNWPHAKTAASLQTGSGGFLHCFCACQGKMD